MASRSLSHTVAGIALVIAGVTVAPAVPAAIYGLIDTSELYSSTNDGATWTILATLPASDAVGLAAGSSVSDLFIAMRSGSIYRSANGGADWTAVGAVSASDVVSFTINYDASVLVLTESGTLYRSIDGGATFSGQAALTASNFVSLARGPLGRLYSLTRAGEVYESQDQGASWLPVGRVTVSNAVSIRRWLGALYILAETGEVYRSIDYGRAWLPVGAITASNMAASLDTGSMLLAAAETGEIYASSNGSSWLPVGAINQATVVSLGGDTPLATGVAAEETVPAFAARAPHPNPTTRFMGSTFLFRTTTPDRVRLEAYDVRGRRVAELGPRPFESAGVHGVSWRPAGLSTGTYFVRATFESGHTASLKWSIVE